jgi:hypothetical protein
MDRMMFEATKATTPFLIYRQLVLDASGLSDARLSDFSARLATAYNVGEPAWMIADEIALRAAHQSKPQKTPRQMALRVVEVAL